MLLALLDALRLRGPTSPALVLEEATFIYRFLETVETRYPIDPILFDEREYFLGEAARIAGTMCRELSCRDDARRWFDRAEGWMVHAEGGSASILRLTYQRLALRTEERDFEAVIELLPQLVWGFEKLGMAEDALKCRFLEGNILKETGRTVEAVTVFERICDQAKSLNNSTLLGLGYVGLTQFYAELGETEKALAASCNAVPVLKSTGNRIGLAKTQWGIGMLYRSQGNPAEAIQAFRSAQHEFTEIEMHADVAAVHLIIADILLDANQEDQAEWEIRAALPVIDEYKLVPEGVAALSLLRESVRRRQIDRSALRNLHGYFPQG